MPAAVRRLVVGTALFALYTPWVSSEVGWEDSAFFQLCHNTLGVPHGPGFPLYVLLGRLFALPFAASPALGSNLLSVAAFAACGVVLFEILLLVGSPSDETSPRALNYAAALTAVAGWATLPVHLPQATRAEVYTLALLLVLAACYAALRAHKSPNESGAWSLAAAWCWGLGMAVHPLIVFAAGTPWLFLAWRAQPGRWRALVCFAAGPMSLYLFPILRGRLDGVWAWGDFSSLGTTLDYFTRRSAWEAVVAVDGGWRENLAGWWSAVPDLVPALLWIPAAWGLWLSRRYWPLILTFALTFLLLVWAAPFDASNLDLLGYALPALAILAIGAGVFAQRGAAYLWAHWPELSFARRIVLGASFLMLAAVWPITSITEATGYTENTGAGIVTQGLDAALPRGATLLVNEDNVFGALEYARALGFRPDLQVISVGSLRHPHYRRMLRQRLPDRLTSGWDVEGVWSEARWKDEMQRLVSGREPGEAWFVQYDRLPGLSSEHLQPRGMVAALSETSSETQWESGLAYWKGRVRAGVRPGPEQEALARWIFNFGVLSLDRGLAGTGWEAMHLALETSPNGPEMYYLLGLALERAGRLTEAKALLGAAVEMAPYRKRYRDALDEVPQTLAVQP